MQIFSLVFLQIRLALNGYKNEILTSRWCVKVRYHLFAYSQKVRKKGESGRKSLRQSVVFILNMEERV